MQLSTEHTCQKGPFNSPFVSLVPLVDCPPVLGTIQGIRTPRTERPWLASQALSKCNRKRIEFARRGALCRPRFLNELAQRIGDRRFEPVQFRR